MRKKALDSVYTLAKKDHRVVFIGSDLGPGVLENMKNEMPDRFFMEGVSEQHIIGMAAGLAMEGFIPYVNTIATFLSRRCFEQVALDLCLQDLPVRLIANGAGGVYAPLGPTHLAVEDIAIMRALPNMTIVCPCDADEMSRFMLNTLDWPHPIYIRLAFEIGKSILMKKGKDGLFISTGVMTQLALQASENLENEGISCGVLHMHTIKPIDENALLNLIPDFKAVVSIEEHTRIGGLGSAILEFCSDSIPNETSKITRIGIPDKFTDQYGSQNTLLENWGITIENIIISMKKKLRE